MCVCVCVHACACVYECMGVSNPTYLCIRHWVPKIQRMISRALEFRRNRKGKVGERMCVCVCCLEWVLYLNFTFEINGERERES